MYQKFKSIIKISTSIIGSTSFGGRWGGGGRKGEGRRVPILDDNLLENSETLQIYLKQNGQIIDSATITIEDSTRLFTHWAADTTICIGKSIVLDGSLNSLAYVEFPFINNATTHIPDNASMTSLIPVTNLPPNAVLNSVCLNINHSNSSNLDIYLVAPSGQIVELSTDNGGITGGYYTNTCFSTTATQSIFFAPNPATGSFLPEGGWGTISTSPVNGVWALAIIDDASSFIGDLLDWTITFSTANHLTYSWQPTNSLSCADCITTTAAPTSTTNYTLDIQTLSGCIIQESVEISVNDIQIAFDVANDTLANHTGSVSATFSGGVPPYHIIWSTNDSSSTLSGLSAGYYDCTVTDALGCSAIATASVSNPSAATQLTVVDKLSIAPNPTMDKVFIHISLHESAPLQLSLYNITGQKLIEKQFSSRNNHQIALDLSPFANGVYFVRFYLNNEIITRRVVLQR